MYWASAYFLASFALTSLYLSRAIQGQFLAYGPVISRFAVQYTVNVTEISFKDMVLSP